MITTVPPSNDRDNYTQDTVNHPAKTATPLSETLMTAALKGSVALGLIGCAAELLRSPNPRQDAIQSLKNFAIGCGIGFLSFPTQIALHQVLQRILPPDLTKTNETQDYLELLDSPSDTIIQLPIMEELALRKTLQQGIFYQALSYGMRLFSLDSRRLLDTKLAKIGRIGATALLFGALHLTNGHHLARNQMIHTTFLGVLLGALKESKLGLPAAIGVHMSNNASVWMLLQQAKRALPTGKLSDCADLDRARDILKQLNDPNYGTLEERQKMIEEATRLIKKQQNPTTPKTSETTPLA